MAFNEYTFPNGQNQIPFQSFPLVLNNSQLSVVFTLASFGKYNEITLLQCEICGSFIRNNIRNCDAHVKKFHAMLKDSPYTFLCDICDSAFDCKKKATEHHNSHAPSAQCDYCYKNFARLHELICHLIEDHQLPINQTYQCKQCGKYFGNYTRLMKHKEECNPGYHFCNKCYSVFESGYLLYEHSANCQESVDPNAIVSSNLHMLDDLLDILNGLSSSKGS